MDPEREDRQLDVGSDGPVTEGSPDALNIHNSGGNLLVNVDRSLAKQFLVIWWISALVSGAAIVGLVAVMMFVKANISYTAVLEYDLMDLRAKTGQAHENTPPPEPQQQTE